MRIASEKARKLRSIHLSCPSAILQNIKESVANQQSEVISPRLPQSILNLPLEFTNTEKHLNSSHNRVKTKLMQTQYDAKPGIANLPSPNACSSFTINFPTRPTTSSQASGPSRQLSAKLQSVLISSPNKKIEPKLRKIHHNRSKTDSFQFKKAVFVNSLQELRDTLQKQSERLTLNDRLRKGMVDGGYIDTERIQLIAQINNFKKIKQRNGINEIR